jgi:hypothetical protein
MESRYRNDRMYRLLRNDYSRLLPSPPSPTFDLSPRPACPTIETYNLTRSNHLTGSGAGNVKALGALLATSQRVAGPGPVGASALGAQDVDGNSVRRNAAGDTSDGQAGDGNASSRSAGGRTVLVVLLDDDAVLGDLGGRVRIWLEVGWGGMQVGFDIGKGCHLRWTA